MDSQQSNKENIYDWDLEYLLDNKSLEDLYKSWIKAQDALVELYPTFLDDIENLKKWIKLEDKLELISNRLSNYISNKLNENIADAYFIGWSQKIKTKADEYSLIFSDLTNKIIKNMKQINSWIEEDKTLKKYKLSFDRIFRTKPHILDEKTEKNLSIISGYNSGFDDIFSTLTDNDLKYQPAVNSKGKEVKIKTQADVFKNLKSLDRELRKSTWYSFHNAFNSIENTLVKTLYYNYLMLNKNAILRKFDNYIDATAFNDEVSVEFIKSVYDNVKSFKDNVIKYNKIHSDIIKNMFELDKVQPWDLSLELSKKEIKYSIESAQETVLEALSVLGEEYTQKVKEAFEQRWISWLPKPGKHTGAYSIGSTKGIDKYFILMNFDETIRSVSTLIHELGHSMNSFYTDTNQKIYDGTSIFYAEVSSITNEQLLNYHLLKKYEKNDKTKLVIYDEMISNFINTTTRQIIFSDFEFKANEMINNGDSFTVESVKQLYKSCVEEYAEIKEKNEQLLNLSLITPLRIPHFYVGNFYVYKYAIGQIAAILIADEINKDPSATEKLFKFLSSGSSLNPLDTIKLLGIDLTTQEPWIKAQEIVSEWIKEYHLLAKKLNYVK